MTLPAHTRSVDSWCQPSVARYATSDHYEFYVVESRRIDCGRCSSGSVHESRHVKCTSARSHPPSRAVGSVFGVDELCTGLASVRPRAATMRLIHHGAVVAISAVGPWEIWCPHWWVQEGCCRLIEIGTEFDTPVGFDFYSEWWTGPARTATVRRIGRGGYSVDSAEVVANPSRGDEVSATWDVQLGDLILSTDGWRSETFADIRAREAAATRRPPQRRRATAAGPNARGSSPATADGPDRPASPDSGREHLDETPTGWTSVPAVTTEDTHGLPDLAIVLTCTVLARTASRR
jgi:hypothetical protein